MAKLFTTNLPISSIPYACIKAQNSAGTSSPGRRPRSPLEAAEELMFFLFWIHFMYWNPVALPTTALGCYFLYILSPCLRFLFVPQIWRKQKLLRNISSQGDAAERLLSQINQRYNESMLVREIGQATSMILDIDKLLQFVMESLEKRLDFDRGMIMLVNKEKDPSCL